MRRDLIRPEGWGSDDLPKPAILCDGRGMTGAWRFFGVTTAVCTLLGVTLIGCSTEQQSSDVPPGVAHRVAEDQTGPQALLEGRVAEIDGCFSIESEDVEGGRVIAVFPSHEVGEAADGEGFAFLDEDYSVGDSIAVGGAMSGASTHELPGACEDDVPQWTVTPSVPAP